MSYLSRLIDHCLEREEHHRGMLLYWKQERQRLERNLDHQRQNVISQAIEVVKRTVSND